MCYHFKRSLSCKWMWWNWRGDVRDGPRGVYWKVLKAAPGSPGGQGVGSWVDVCPTRTLGRKDDVEGWEECAFQRHSLNSGPCIYILHKDVICRPQLDPWSDVRIILPFHTLSCFSLNYNWFLHNEKPAEEWQSIKNYFSPPRRLVAE